MTIIHVETSKVALVPLQLSRENLHRWPFKAPIDSIGFFFFAPEISVSTDPKTAGQQLQPSTRPRSQQQRLKPFSSIVPQLLSLLLRKTISSFLCHRRVLISLQNGIHSFHFLSPPPPVPHTPSLPVVSHFQPLIHHKLHPPHLPHPFNARCQRSKPL